MEINDNMNNSNVNMLADVQPARAEALPVIAPIPPTPSIPAYLLDTYKWAYVSPKGIKIFNRDWVVNTILWGNNKLLISELLKEIKPGANVLQAASVYGDFSKCLAVHIGNKGSLQVIDIVPNQIESCSRRLKDFPWVNTRVTDAANPGEKYEVICCYFLLHEVPLKKKHEIVTGLLDSLEADGKIIFIDYHKPHFLHPLNLVMKLIWFLFEPFAKELTESEIINYSADDKKLKWSKTTYFGGLYQKVVVTKK